MNNKHYIGRDVRSLEHYDKIGPITGVSILVDENNEYVPPQRRGNKRVIYRADGVKQCDSRAVQRQIRAHQKAGVDPFFMYREKKKKFAYPAYGTAEYINDR